MVRLVLNVLSIIAAYAAIFASSVVYAKDSAMLVRSSAASFWDVSTLDVSTLESAVSSNLDPSIEFISIDQQRLFQKWEGFGGSFNEAGWDALLTVSQKDREHAMRLLFDENEGLGFTIGRIPIGASDYALSRYSLAPIANDYGMKKFSIERDQRLLIPFVKAAQAINKDLGFVATPWAPPTWLTQVNPKEKYASDGASMRSDPKALKAYALYLLRFVTAYKKEGVSIGKIHPQNEPGFKQHYPSCSWSGELMQSFIADYMGPMFSRYAPETEIWLAALSNSKSKAFAETVMSNPDASRFIKGLGLQWGMEHFAQELGDRFKLPVMQTEHRSGNYPWASSGSVSADSKSALAPNDYSYAIESWALIKKWLKSGVSSYLAWNMVLDRSGKNLDEQRIWHQNALLVVNREEKTVSPTPAYWVFRHIAGFVRPGARRTQMSADDGLVFKNPDGSLVAVLYNKSLEQKSVSVSMGTRMYEFDIPSLGWSTLVVPSVSI